MGVPIYIDKITSGKGENSVFSFYYKGKMVKKQPFELKAANQFYNYAHHLDEDDLAKIQSVFHDIYPYSLEKHTSINDYIDIMTQRLYQLITNGQIAQALALTKGKPFSMDIKIEWVGKSPQ